MRVVVNGAAGRMGRTIVETAADRDDLGVVAGLDVDVDEPVDGVPIHPPADAADVLAEHEPDAVVDFTVPAATLDLAEACTATGVAMVVGTTGFDDDELEELRAAAEEVAVLKATNFSRGIQALLRAVEAAVAALPAYDAELLETHHNAKLDAPSGTAKTILETVREQRDLEAVHGREGEAPRDDDEIGVFARRAGDVRGEHELLLAGNDEVLELTHRAEDRAVFAAGALDAAAWLAEQDRGWYTFGEVIDDQ